MVHIISAVRTAKLRRTLFLLTCALTFLLSPQLAKAGNPAAAIGKSTVIILRVPFGKANSAYVPGSIGDTPIGQLIGNGGRSGNELPGTYTVKRGDCLWKIAAAIYGDPHRWREIYQANTDKIKNPNLIYPGQQLVIPGGRGAVNNSSSNNASPGSTYGTKDGQNTSPVQQPSGSGAFNQVRPVDHASVSSNYGMRMHPIKGYRKMHYGIDLSLRGGSPIRATGPGRVIQANWSGGYGNVVKIQHPDGTITIYAHCKGFNCRRGDTVRAGQQIATVNSTGLSTGDHLHFEVQVGGAKKDPRNYFNFPSKGSSF